MEFYIKSLFIAIPLFIVFIFIEIIASKIKGVKVNEHSDMISSLSSGISNTLKDAFRLSIVLVSYNYLVDQITIYPLESLWISIFIAFLAQDFSGYWMHRLQHRVNIFWNSHIIHHSSEEFNLSCALRQSISETFKFSALLMLPAALLGIPASIFAILGPIHLFLQFWYHTRLIDKMGFLEYIIVTPSHHRVHHAINAEYIDKNYGQILIIWDRLFNTFQPELVDIKPVYGTLRPVKTWNPILINFKHIYQITKDAWYAEKAADKLRIWFMPTGWRPEDVKRKFPLEEVYEPNDKVKYKTANSNLMLAWSWIQHVFAGLMLFHLFTVMNVNNPSSLDYLYGVFIMVHIFSFTSTLDFSKYCILAELLKVLLGFYILHQQNKVWFNLTEILSVGVVFYLIISFILTIQFYSKNSNISITN